MKKFLFFSLAAAALLTGCAKSVEDEAIEAPLHGTRVVTLKAAAETTDSKVAYAGETTFGWQAGDCIGLYVYDHANDSRLYVPADFAGNDGDTNGDFTLTLAADQDYYKVAWYPYFEVSADWTDAGVLTLDFNSQKDFSTLKAGEMPMPMVAYFPDDTDKASLQFKNVGGLVKITVNNVPANARYFKLVADKQISGPFTLDLENDQLGTVECTLQPGSVGSNAIEYIYEDGATTELNLYYPVPVGNFKFGFEIYTEAGIEVYKKEIEATSNENTIERGDILRMPAITVTDVAPEYKLIGYREGDETWSTNLEAQAVAGQYGWFVIKNVRPGASDNLSFKLRKTDAWSPDEDIFGQPDGKFFQVPGKLISLVHPGNDITFVGSEKSYDIYFNEAEQKLFALENPSVFAVPTEATTNNYYHLIGEVGTLNWNKNLPSVDVASFDGWRVIKDVPVNAGNKLNFKLRKADDWGNAVVLAYPGGDGTLAVGTVLNASDAGGGNIFVEGAAGDKFDVYVNASLKKIIVLKSGETFEYPIVSLQKEWINAGQAGVGGWSAFITGAEDLDGNSGGYVRNATFDDDYVYIPKNSGASADGSNFDEASILKFKVSDGTYAGKVQRTTTPDYMAGTWASTFPVSSVRVMKNTDSSVNGGKDVLVAVNLCDGSGQRVRVYAWPNGIDAEPVLLANFAGMNERRWGDKITVEGTYQEGRIWYRNFYSVGTTAWLAVKDGAIPDAYFYALGAISANTDNAFTEFKSFNKGAFGLISNNLSAGTYLVQGSTVKETYTQYKRAWGWSEFNYKGQDYLAYLDLADGTNMPRITVLKGSCDTYANLKATLDDHIVAARVAFAIDDPSDFTSTTAWAYNGIGDCSVRIIGGEPYILGMTRGSMGLFKFSVEE